MSRSELLISTSVLKKQFGYKKTEVLGKTVEMLIPALFYKDYVKCSEEYVNAANLKTVRQLANLDAKKKNGDCFPVEVRLADYTVGTHSFLLALVTDTMPPETQQEIGQQKQEFEKVTTEINGGGCDREKEVMDPARMRKEASVRENDKELGELKSRFITMASHEFRTPLSTILSSTFLLEKYSEYNADPRVEKHLQRIKGAVGGMKGILEDFLSIGKLEDGMVQPEMERVSATELVDLLNGLRLELHLLLKPGQQILFQNTITEAVYADQNLLKSILTNLISNAIKFSNANATITISSAIADDYFTISVADEGIGISERDQVHLYERFFRAKNAMNIEGTGLGLHIVRKYLELMNGRIEMISKLNKGSVFTIYIPQHIQSAIYEKDISY